MHSEGVEKSLFYKELKQLKIPKLLKSANISKDDKGISAFKIFEFLLTLVFRNMNLFRFLNSPKKDCAASKNTYYRFLNNPSFNWNKFLTSLAYTVVTFLSRLTSVKRKKCFIIDDSVFSRNRSKNVELLAKIYDHVSHKFVKGFTLLPLAWTDGFSTIPVSFRLLSSPKKENRYNNYNENFKKNSLSYKRRMQSIESKPNSVVSMLKEALKNGISADYVLMDTWFTTEPLINQIKELGLDVIGMVKPLKQKYKYNDEYYTLHELKRLVTTQTINEIMGSLIVETKNGIKVKIVFVKHRENKRKILCILSTDISLEDTEVIRLYGNRWNIEPLFKALKSNLKLGKEFQSRGYDALVAHTSIVLTRYIILEWKIRNEKDHRTFGELCFVMCEEISDMNYKEAIESIMGLIKNLINNFKTETIETLISQLTKWYLSQPRYIMALVPTTMWES